MSIQHTLVLVETASPLSENLIEFLHARGYTVQSAVGFQRMFEVMTRTKSPLLIIDVGKGEAVAPMIDKLLSLRVLANIPLILMGEKLEKHESRVGEVFQNVLPLSHPFTNTDLVSAIEYLIDQLSAVKEIRIPSRVEAPVEDVESGGARPGKKIDEKSDRTSRITDVSKPASPKSETLILSVPELCFSEMLRLKISERELGHSQYSMGSKPKRLKGVAYLPEESAVLKRVEEICARAGTQGASHIHRSSFLSYQVLDAIRMDPELRETAKNASFLFCWGLADDKQLLLGNYLFNSNTELRKQISEKMNESANSIAEYLDLPKEEAIVRTIARFIGEDTQVENNDISIISSAIMAADLTDRVCFQRGFWDPRLVYHFLRRVKAADIPDVHPAVLSSILAMLTRAVSEQGRRFHTHKHSRRDAARQEVIGEDPAPLASEEEIPLKQLSPGMRLARPLRTFDGRTIIPRDVLLDEDMIWRIWQLSAMRAVNSAYVVRT